MWNPNIKVTDITKLVQIIFNAWFEYFEYVGSLPRGVTLTLEYHPARTLLYETWQATFDIFNSHITFSIYCSSLFSVFQLCFYLS